MYYSRKLAHTTRQFPAILQPNPKFSERLEGQLEKHHLMQTLFCTLKILFFSNVWHQIMKKTSILGIDNAYHDAIILTFKK